MQRLSSFDVQAGISSSARETIFPKLTTMSFDARLCVLRRCRATLSLGPLMRELPVKTGRSRMILTLRLSKCFRIHVVAHVQPNWCLLFRMHQRLRSSRTCRASRLQQRWSGLRSAISVNGISMSRLSFRGVRLKRKLLAGWWMRLWTRQRPGPHFELTGYA